MNRNRQQRTSRAFTLIELLVVVAIIALLISILIPSLGRARESAKSTVCKGNLRSVGQAFSMYAQDSRGLWPPTIDTLGTQNRWPVPFYHSHTVNEELVSYADDGTAMTPAGKSIFLCPSETVGRAIRNWNGTTHTVDRVEIGGSYAYSSEVHRNGDELQRGSTYPPPPTPPFINPIDNCRRTGDVIMLMENHHAIATVTDPGWRFDRGQYGEATDAFYKGYRTTSGAPVTDPRADAYKIIGGRHAGMMNVLFVDSHVDVTKPQLVTYNQVSWNPWTDTTRKPPGGQ